MTPVEAESKRRKAVEFLRRVGRDEDAARFDGMTATEYAERRGAELAENPKSKRRAVMQQTVGVTKAELSDTLDQIAELAEESLDSGLTREEVVAKVKEISDVASGEEDEEEEEEEEHEDPA